MANESRDLVNNLLDLLTEKGTFISTNNNEPETINNLIDEIIENES